MRIDATEWLNHLDGARDLALAGDAEGVHQVRVALRRLRVWLEFKGHESLAGELRWLCRALAELRDLDVFGEVLTEEVCAQLRPEAVEEAMEALQSERWAALRQALAEVRAPKRSRAKQKLKRFERTLEKLRTHLPEGDGEALHRLRRALRRVRYSREWLGLDTAELAVEQDLLGAVCDLLALQAFAKRHQVAVPAPLVAGIDQGFELLWTRLGGAP
jgi:CHAD domain-containing protein